MKKRVVVQKKRKPSNKTIHSGKKLSASQVYRSIPVLELISQVKDPKQRRKLLDLAGPRAIDSASSICRNIISGNLRVKNPLLRKTVCEKRRLDTEALAALNTPYKRKKLILLGRQRRSGQKGGVLPFLPILASLIPSVIGTIGSLITGK